MIQLICTTLVCLSASQIGEQRLPIEVIPKMSVPSLDYASLYADDVNREESGLPLRFAVPTPVSVTPQTHGIWERLRNNKMRWSYLVTCDNARSMNIGFGKYTMPSSGSMTIMDPTGEIKIRPFTAVDNKDHGELWTPIIPGNEALIEITVDRSQQRDVNRQIELTSINSGYQGFRSEDDRGSSESCNIDVMCPEGDDWWNEIPSVAVITISGGWVCSGVMLNNTAEDQTPYFMTANHCVSTSGEASSVVAYWNHQNSYCRTGSASGNNGDGSTSQWTSGSTLRATRSYTDFTLVELSSSPNTGWGVTYSGWSRSSSTSGVGAGIHHPEGAEKRISIPDYSNASGEWWNVNWSLGRTAQGSSGSPLYDSNHRIVGVLSWGYSYCPNDDNDYYGRSIGQSWSYLDDYLDPTGSNVTYLDTLNSVNLPNGACCIVGSCVDVRESNCVAAGGSWQGADTLCSSGICDPPNDCPTDVNGDDVTNVTDLLEVIAAWGSTSSTPADINEDGVVNVADLLEIIAAWGPCSQ